MRSTGLFERGMAYTSAHAVSRFDQAWSSEPYAQGENVLFLTKRVSHSFGCATGAKWMSALEEDFARISLPLVTP